MTGSRAAEPNRTREGDELPSVESRLSSSMPRTSVIAVAGLSLAFASGWLVGRAGGSDGIPGRLEAPPALVPSRTASAEPVTKTPPAPADASPDAAVTRRELTPSAVHENVGLVRSALFSAAQGLAASCYVELREATLARLDPNLGGTDRQRAHAAVDAFVEAEYRYLATENTVLLERFIWQQPPPRTGGSGIFRGKFGSLTVGSVEFEYMLNFEEYPQLAKAHTDQSTAHDALAPFLTR